MIDEKLAKQRQEVRDMLKGNWRDFWKGDFWPWMQTLSTIVLLLILIIANSFNAFTVLSFLAWVAFNAYALYRGYQAEKITD